MFERFPKTLEVIRNKAIILFRKYYVPRWMVFVMDSLFVFLTFYLAYLLRFNFVTSDFSFNIASKQSLISLCIYALFSMVFRPFSGLIRHTTIIDIFYVLLSTSSAMVVVMCLSWVSRNMEWNVLYTLPFSIILIHYVLVTLILFFIRMLIKTFYQIITSSFIGKKKILIYGAGAMGVIVKRVLQSDVKSEYQIVGFLDNNKKLQGKKLNGISVYKPDAILTKEYLDKHKIQTLIFGIQDIPSAEKSEIIRSALDIGLEVLDTPPIDKWLNGQLSIRQIQKVKLEDLLGRDPIQLNMKRIEEGLTGKVILVTGAAGSIGSEIVRQLTRFQVKILILVDQAETPVFNLENELKVSYSQCPVQIILADITHQDKMEKIFQEYHPDVVFHAAAYKHVPLMEYNPHEAIRVNVGGTRNLTKLSLRYGVKKFVMISTDKAVNPTNVMGASKRLCEIILQLKAHQSGNKTQFIITRFGNVLGSNGSVIPIFTKQIAEGGPVTVTHPEITRYFMTIPEACQLVLEAGFMGKGGEIFVFDMGKPVKIIDLAHQMIRLSGLIPEKDIRIVFTGLRPGEKLFEELLTNRENTLTTHHTKIQIAQVESLNNKEMLTKINALIANLYTFSKQEVVNAFRELVPEYQCNNIKYDHQPHYITSLDIGDDFK